MGLPAAYTAAFPVAPEFGCYAATYTGMAAGTIGVDATGALSDDAHAQIRAAVADLRPHASGRAFYVSWDTEAKAEGGP